MPVHEKRGSRRRAPWQVKVTTQGLFRSGRGQRIGQAQVPWVHGAAGSSLSFSTDDSRVWIGSPACGWAVPNGGSCAKLPSWARRINSRVSALGPSAIEPRPAEAACSRHWHSNTCHRTRQWQLAEARECMYFCRECEKAVDRGFAFPHNRLTI